MRKLLFILGLCFGPMLLWSQQMHLFGDSVLKLRPATIGGHVIHDGAHSYIISSSTNGNGHTQTTIIKVDTSGNTIWTSNPANYMMPGLEAVDMVFTQVILGSDKDLYAWMNPGRLVKIRAGNGSVDWLVPAVAQPGLYRFVVEYDEQTVILAHTLQAVFTTHVRLNRYNKETGAGKDSIELYCPGQGIFGIKFGPGGSIFLSSRDSCYKYTSWDNPVLEWKAPIYTGSQRYGNLQHVALEGNNLFIFGSKLTLPNSGRVSCIDITTGTLKWFQEGPVSEQVGHGDHKVKDGFLYTVWKPYWYASKDEKCIANKIDINTGTKIWQVHHPIRSQPTGPSKSEGMTSLNIDNNGTIFLAGYGWAGNPAVVSLALMKLRSGDGSVIRRGFIPGSEQLSEFPIGINARLLNGKLYVVGEMDDNVGTSRVDTAALGVERTNLFTSSIQYGSSVVGIKPVSANKKMIVKKVGKWLKVEMVDPYFNRIWEKTIGDTLDAYEGIDVLGGNDAEKTVDVPSRLFENARNNFLYFTQHTAPDSFHINRFDTAGNITYTFRRNEIASVTNPYQFFQDSTRRTWYVQVAGTDISGVVFPPDAAAGVGVSGKWTPRPYQLIRPATVFAYTKDTVLMFREPTGTTFRASLLKSWPPYLPNLNSRYLFFPDLEIRWFNSVERENKDVFYVSARDSSMNDLVFKYRLTDSTVLWTNTESPSYLTIKGYEFNGSFYALRTHGTDILIQKYNGADGSTIWTRTVPVPAGHVFNISDFAMSKSRQVITLTGGVEDTLIRGMTKVYIISYDVSGNEVHSLLKDGYKTWQNKGMSITIGQDGQTLVSGQISDSIHGYAGFIYEVDATTLSVHVDIPAIADVAASVCSNATARKGRLMNPPRAPYAISIVMDNTVSVPFEWSDSTFSYPIADAGSHTIRVTYSYQNSSSFRDSSFVVKATPPAGGAPSLAGNVLTAPATGDSYQWYQGAAIVAGATSQTYTIPQNGTYSYTYTVNGCVSPMSAPLNAVITSVVDPTNNNAIITFYPNPTSGNLVIHNLSPSNQYGVRVIDQTGKQVLGPVSLPRGNSYTVRLEQLPAGPYMLQLWNLSKKTLVGNQQILIVK